MVEFLKNKFVFYEQMFREAKTVGAFASASRAVAEEIASPIKRKRGQRLNVLEVGAGTGALTKAVVEKLGPGDTLTLVEINPHFVQVLRELFRTRPGGPEITIFDQDIEALPREARYDVIVSSLPLMNFPPDKVRRIYDLYLERLVPGGTISYFDYWAKELRTFVTPRPEREQMREALRIQREYSDKYEVHKRVIPWNVMPACVHHLRRD